MDPTAIWVNQGQSRWHFIRSRWLSSCTEINEDEQLNKKLKNAISLEIDNVIDSIFTSDGKSTLSYSIPLPQIIDILTDLWEADGLYD